MNRRIAAILLLISIFLCSTLPAQSNSDDHIHDQVRMKLANNPDVKGAAIEVKVEEGVVTLQGSVRSDKARSKAESLTGKIKGVRKVVNELRVVPI